MSTGKYFSNAATSEHPGLPARAKFIDPMERTCQTIQQLRKAL